MTLGAAYFYVAGAALGARPARFAWQAQHLEHLRFVLRGRRSTWGTFIDVSGSPATSDDFWAPQHLEYLRLVLRAGAALGAPS